ncbi:hypothetical protein [Phenylobacterium sp.]|uniref:hypothetical protein n=1 Tax=Phenylobacterium sp. TaxID=1871053 RepID=UPI0025F938B2|nr:hypothetical protein [Phenylobacterium sp.]
MQTLILNRDLKTLFQGVGVVAAAGLLLGAVCHPNLRGETVAEGPQMLLNGGGARGAASAGDAGLSAYGGRTPEYVIGTDWTRPRAEPAQAAAPDEERGGETVVYTAHDDRAPVQVTHAAWRDDDRPLPVYPSAQGGVPYEANLPVAPPPPGETDAG